MTNALSFIIIILYFYALDHTWTPLITLALDNMLFNNIK